LLFCHDFGRGREIAEVDGHVVFAEGDFLGNGLDDFAFFFAGEVGPTAIQIPGFSEELVA